MNKWFINVLKWTVNAAWYMLIPSMMFVCIVFIMHLYFIGYFIWEIPVALNQPGKILPALAAGSWRGQFAGVDAAEAVLKVNLKVTPAILTSVVLFFVTSMFCLLGTLYHLRKILGALQPNTPFAFENIRRLRMISLFLFLLAIIICINSLLNLVLVPPYFPGMKDIYQIRINWGIKPLMASLGMFALSEICKQGYPGKTDNKSVVQEGCY